jgi:hypothetical protein
MAVINAAFLVLDITSMGSASRLELPGREWRVRR